MGRKLLAGILGGLAFFAWSTLAHTVLPLGGAGVQELPNDQVLMAAMQANISKRGLYLFPSTGLPANATQAQKNEAMKEHFKKTATGPSGLLVYHPTRPAGFLRMMAMELATNIVQLVLGAFLLGLTSLSGFGARWGFTTVVGILAAISTNISYWNWYGFPRIYTLSSTFTIAMGFAIGGLVVAAMVKPGAAMRTTKAAAA